MPIIVHAPTRRLSQEEFTAIAFDVMRHVFDVHNELGRLFDESIYQKEVARRCGGRTEVQVEVTHAGFRKLYFLDLLVGDGAIFELKAVGGLTARHYGQLLNYLLLCDLPRGKLVNIGRESVEHEFVNTTLRTCDRTTFAVDDHLWDSAAGGIALRTAVEAMLLDLGTGLDVGLYHDFASQILGGEFAISRDIEIVSNGQTIGRQTLSLAAPDAAFRFSAIRDEDCPRFAEQLRRFLSHTNLRILHWVNITLHRVSFTTLHSPCS